MHGSVFCLFVSMISNLPPFPFFFFPLSFVPYLGTHCPNKPHGYFLPRVLVLMFGLWFILVNFTYGSTWKLGFILFYADSYVSSGLFNRLSFCHSLVYTTLPKAIWSCMWRCLLGPSALLLWWLSLCLACVSFLLLSQHTRDRICFD